MGFPKHIWDQVRNLSADELIRALEKDGFVLERSSGAIRLYRHPRGRRVSIHYHPRKTFGADLLKELLSDIGWSEKDMRRLKLIK